MTPKTIYFNYIDPIFKLDFWKIALILLSVGMFVQFVAYNRLAIFITNISNSIIGNGSAIELTLDGLTIILVIFSAYLIGITLQGNSTSIKPIPPQLENHPALTRIILPSHINEAYLTQEERAKIEHKRAEQEVSRKVNEREKVSSFLGAVPGFQQLLENEKMKAEQTRQQVDAIEHARAKQALEDSLKEQEKYTMQQDREEKAREAIRQQMLKSIHDPSRKQSFVVRDVTTLDEVYKILEKDENVLESA